MVLSIKQAPAKITSARLQKNFYDSTVVTHLSSGSVESNNYFQFSAVVTIRSKAKIYATPDLIPAQVVALLRASIDAVQVAVGVVGEPGRAIQRIEHKSSRVKVSQLSVGIPIE
jgi:hypothetical protein